MAIFSRILAALFGGYLLANVAAIAVSYLLPGSRADAVIVSIFASFIIYAGAVIWVFSARTVRAAWLGLLIPGMASGVIIFGLYPQVPL
jgi:hypothetical protein